MSSESTLHSTAKKNIELIVQIEQQLLRKRSRMERVGEGITHFFGSLQFIVAHVAFIAAWICFNIGRDLHIQPFDPYPFALLSLVVSIEFIFLTTFVLLNQKYQMRRTEQWTHLHLQLSMLTEQEVTKNMKMLQLICQRLHLQEPSQDPELQELAKATAVTALADEIVKVREWSKELLNELERDSKVEE